MVKNIIFDFGDVFINLDKKAPERELQQKTGINGIDKEMHSWHDAYEKGLITTEKLTALYTERFPQLDPETFSQTWNSILLDFPQGRLEWLKALAASHRYRLFLLSNTNAMHIDRVINIMGGLHYEVFRECFERFYLSFEIQLSKPDSEIYKLVLGQNGLLPQESLFIDDTPANTKAAAALGINIWNISPGKEDVTDLFELKKELF